jgi:acyl-CoA reductase-like NAD-dependent aldehyde dehydrogenase
VNWTIFNNSNTLSVSTFRHSAEYIEKSSGAPEAGAGRQATEAVASQAARQATRQRQPAPSRSPQQAAALQRLAQAARSRRRLAACRMQRGAAKRRSARRPTELGSCARGATLCAELERREQWTAGLRGTICASAGTAAAACGEDSACGAGGRRSVMVT